MEIIKAHKLGGTIHDIWQDHWDLIEHTGETKMIILLS